MAWWAGLLVVAGVVWLLWGWESATVVAAIAIAVAFAPAVVNRIRRIAL